jgi:hypothetical protein
MIDENTSSGAQMISILENRVEIIQLLAAQNVYMAFIHSLLELMGFLLPAVAYHVSGSLVVLYTILIVYYIAHALKLPAYYKSYKVTL